MKFIKVLFLTLFIFVLLLSAAAYVVLTHYKKELTALFIDSVKKDYGVDLEAEDIRISLFSNWPQASVQLKNVKVKSESFRDSYVTARSLALSFNLQRMLNKEFIIRYVSIRDAEVVFVVPPARPPLKVATARADTAAAKPLLFEISKISLRNTKFRMLNPAIGQNIAIDFIHNTLRLRQFTDGMHLSVKGRVYIPGLLFREKRGEFLKESKAELDLEIDYFKDDNSLCVRPGSSARVNGHPYLVTSIVQLDAEKKLSLIISSRNIHYLNTGALMNQKIRRVLARFTLGNPVDAKLLLVVNIGKREDPIILLDFEGRNNDLRIGSSDIPYTGLAFRGRLVCMEPSMARGEIENARLNLLVTKGRMYDFPFTARIALRNFGDPVIHIKGRLNVDASKIAFRLKNDFELKGHAVARITYSGLASKMNFREFLEPGMKLKADLQLKNLSYRENDRPWVYTVNGRATMDNKDLNFRNLQVSTDVAEAEVSGRAENFTDYLLGKTNGFRANLAVNTESLNLNPVLMKHAAKAKDTGLTSMPVPAPGGGDSLPSQTNSAMVNAAASLTKNYSSFEFNVGLFAKNLRVRNVLASNANMHLHYKDEVLEIKSMQARICEGRVKGSGVIRNFTHLNADLTVEDVDVQEMFRQFENFGQSAVLSENLQGRIWADAKFKTALDDRMEVAGETMYGEVSLSLKDGHLLNFEPVQNLSSFLFRNRDFNDIAFSELNESFILRGYEMQIDELEIGSNILDLYVVNGLYNFKGNSNINVLLPWSNLKSRKNFIPSNSGESAESTKGIKINFSGPANNMKISLGHKELVQMRPSI